MVTVYQKAFTLPEIDKREALRYAGVRGRAAEVETLFEECVTELSLLFHPKVCWCRLGIDDAVQVPEIAKMLSSNGLAKHLDGCSEIVVFAATVGVEIDRAISRYGAISPTKSLLASAIGSERIETLCDCFESFIGKEGREMRKRFSPGYSDLPLDSQKDIFSLLNCPRMIGVALNDSLLMSPSKSVSAIIGIK